MRQRAVVGAGTGGAMALLASLQGMDFPEFVAWLLTSGGAAAAIWGIIALLERLWRGPLSSNFKFYFAQGLSLIVPVGALGVSVWAGWLEWSLTTLFATLAVAYQVSQTFHWEEDQSKKGAK